MIFHETDIRLKDGTFVDEYMMMKKVETGDQTHTQ